MRKSNDKSDPVSREPSLNSNFVDNTGCVSIFTLHVDANLSPDETTTYTRGGMSDESWKWIGRIRVGINGKPTLYCDKSSNSAINVKRHDRVGFMPQESKSLKLVFYQEIIQKYEIGGHLLFLLSIVHHWSSSSRQTQIDREQPRKMSEAAP